MNELREPKFAEEGGSDYEVYIRTDELLALQPEPDTWKHRDELLFTVVHQSSELWLKLAVAEIAHLLEYSETVNFRRAFVRWNGITPNTYRQHPHG